MAEVPPGVMQHTQLKGLYLAGNRIRLLPAEMTKMRKLAELDLRGNPLQTNEHACDMRALRGKPLIASFLKKWTSGPEPKIWFAGGSLVR